MMEIALAVLSMGAIERPVSKLALLTDIQINPCVYARSQLDKRAFIIGRLICVGLFKLFFGHLENYAIYEIRRDAGELNGTVMRGATHRHKALILDLNHGQAISGQDVWLAFQSSTKRGELNRLRLQSSIGKQILRLSILKIHILFAGKLAPIQSPAWQSQRPAAPWPALPRYHNACGSIRASDPFFCPTFFC